MNVSAKQPSLFTGVLTVAFTLALGGCGKKDEPAPAAKAKPASVEPAAVAKKPLTAAWFGKVATPPAPLAAFKAGMPVADAKKLAPDHYLEGIDIDGVRAGWQDGSGAKVGSLGVTFPAEHMALVTEAWGPGISATRGNDKNTVWFDPEAGVRAELSLSADKKSADLRFESYLPASKLLGEGPSIAFFSKPVLGVPLSEVKKSYAEYLDGDDVKLPFSDFTLAGGSGTTIRFKPSDGSAPVTSYELEISYKSNPAFKDELLALFEKKWGKPTAAPPPASDTSVYHAANPRVEIAVESRGRFVITVTEK
jgi:hypothetical protein